MREIEKMYENANIKPKYRYDCNLEDTIEVLTICGCSKGEIRDYCTNKQDYQYCKVYKVNKIYPPFTAKKQIELIKWLSQHTYRNYIKFRFDICGLWYCECNMSNSDMHHTFEDALIDVLIQIWQDLTEEEKQQVKGILE